jgi:hypothetical protein
LMNDEDDEVWIKHAWGLYSGKTCLEVELLWNCNVIFQNQFGF